LDSNLQTLAWTGGGNDSDILQQKRLEIYGELLHEGDFEYYQPFCYADKNSIHYKKEKLRAMWIRMRFCEFGSEEWSTLQEEFRRLRDGV
jgi:hypothetical protein